MNHYFVAWKLKKNKKTHYATFLISKSYLIVFDKDIKIANCTSAYLFEDGKLSIDNNSKSIVKLPMLIEEYEILTEEEFDSKYPLSEDGYRKYEI